MVVGPIALAYNVAGVDDLRLKPATIAGIFNGDFQGRELNARSALALASAVLESV